MRTFELRVYTLRTKEAFDFYAETIYPRHLHSFPLFGSRLTASGPRRTMQRLGFSCCCPTQRATILARSRNATCKARSWPMTSETLMSPTS